MFCANKPAETAQPNAVKKSGFVYIDFFAFNNTKVNTINSHALDKNQEILPVAFFRILLSVSGVMPSMDARYCSGTRLNKSALK